MKRETLANKLWIEASLKKWGNMCLTCGASATTFHHFIAKSRCNNLRYDVKNSIPLCQKDHYVIHFSKDTLKRRALEDKIIDSRGPGWLEYIESGSRTLINKNKMWVEEQIERLKE